VAEKAGLSIGTLYQYFDDKQSLLDALVRRELGAGWQPCGSSSPA
jgi:AcrR family transcriptional regulator